MRTGFRVLAAVLLAWFCGGRAAVADPALWMVTGGAGTAYLFGTIHVLPQGEAWLDPAIRTAFSAAGELWTEADVSDLSAAVDAIRRYGLTASESPEALLPPAYRPKFQRQIALAGVSAAFLAHAQPWLAEILLSGAAMQKTGPLELGVDATLSAMAHDRHMKTPTFETLDEQFALLSGMSAPDQIASLEEQIDEFDRAGEQFNQMLAAWRAGDQAALDREINEQMRSRSETAWDALILRRNKLFAARIKARIAEAGTIFVAVGAGHLCGAQGVPELLRQEGYQVKRVQ